MRTGFHPGLRIMYCRRLLGQTQKGLADALTAAGDETWNKQKVSRIETGTQDISWSELELIARVQRQPIGWYVEPDTISDNPGYLNTPLFDPDLAQVA